MSASGLTGEEMLETKWHIGRGSLKSGNRRQTETSSDSERERRSKEDELL